MEKNNETLHILRHSASHIMAQAVQKLFPKAKLAIGPAVDNGFYYDFDVEKPFSDEDKEKIEEEMKKIIKEDLAIERFELPRDEALKLMQEKEKSIFPFFYQSLLAYLLFLELYGIHFYVFLQ